MYICIYVSIYKWNALTLVPHASYIYMCIYIHSHIYVHIYIRIYICTYLWTSGNANICTTANELSVPTRFPHVPMGWLRLVGSSKLLVSFAKEPY